MTRTNRPSRRSSRAAGTVETVSVMRDMATGRARGFAFVEMASDEDAQKAISMLNDHDFGGRNLMVNEARPKPQGGGGGGAAAADTAAVAAATAAAPSRAGKRRVADGSKADG